MMLILFELWKTDKKGRNSWLVFSQGLVVMQQMDGWCSCRSNSDSSGEKECGVWDKPVCCSLFSLSPCESEVRWLHRPAETQWATAAAVFDSEQGLTSTSCLRLFCPPLIFERLLQCASQPSLPSFVSLCLSVFLSPHALLTHTQTNRERERERKRSTHTLAHMTANLPLIVPLPAQTSSCVSARTCARTCACVWRHLTAC